MAGLAALQPAQHGLQPGLRGILRRLGLVRAEIGGRLNTLDTQESLNTGLEVELRVARSQVEDLDYTEAAGLYNRQLLGLQAAQQAFVKVQGLSLFNFI